MLIVGLGNPGDKHVNTKHNMGFSVIDQLAQKHDYSFKLGKGEYMFSYLFAIPLARRPENT